MKWTYNDVAGKGTVEKPVRELYQSLIDNEKDTIEWLHTFASLGIVIAYNCFFEEILHDMQVSSNGKMSRAIVEKWAAEFRRRWADKLQSGPAGPLLPDTATPLSPSAWYRTASAAVASLYPAVPFADPERLLCLGEMNVQLDRQNAAVRRTRSVEEAAAAARDNVAFVTVVSAGGDRAPPLMVTPSGGLVRGDLLAEDDCLHHTTTNGTVTPEALLRYLAESLEPYLMLRQVARPALLYVDGRHHHASRAIGRFCDSAGLILLGLPPGGAARSPVRGAIAALLTGNLARMADGVQRGRRTEPDGGCSTSARALLTGFRAATRRATSESIQHTFQWSGLSQWSEAVVSACESAPPPSDEPAEPCLPPPAPEPLPPAPLPSPVGLPVPPTGLPLDQAVRLLLGLGGELPALLKPADLPRPGPQGVAFTVNSQAISQRLKAIERPGFDSGDGWIAGWTTTHSYLINESVFERLYENSEGRLCVREAAKEQLEPLLMPDDKMVEVCCMISTWWNNTDRLRRVTLISAAHSENVTVPPVALCEFCPEGGQEAPPSPEPPSPEEQAEQERTTQGAEEQHEHAGGGREPRGDAEPPAENAEVICESEEDEKYAESMLPPSDVLVHYGEYTSIAIPATGLPAGQLIRFLLNPDQHGIPPAPSRPPAVKTGNTGYLVDNEMNRSRRWKGLSTSFADGPEKWEGGGTTPGRRLAFLLDGLEIRQVTGVRGCYFHQVERDGKLVTERLETTRTGKEVEVRLVQIDSRQADGPLCRRISWVDRCDPPRQWLPPVALYEYMGPTAASTEPESSSRLGTPLVRLRTDLVEEVMDSGQHDEEGGKRAVSGQDQVAGQAGDAKRQRLGSDQ